mgnify:CR=1 FL=1
MSFKIDQNTKTMYLTRGDTAQFTITPYRNKNKYELQEGDRVDFTIKKSTKDSVAVISKTGTEIEILPQDTGNLMYGTYKYDCQITFADGRVDTFIGPYDFVITEEVTF